MTNFHFLIIFITVLLNNCICHQHISNLCPSNINVNRTHTPIEAAAAAAPTCDCTNESSSPWGLRVLRIDCSSNFITYENFQDEILPLNTEYLDLSWNKFNEVPDFFGKSLKTLIFCHNQLTKIADKNFIHISNLRKLDLSWNRIEFISVNVFAELYFLSNLNLSHNNLKKISFNSFSSLISLEDLNLSWNQKLNESLDLQEIDFFLALSVTPKLKILKLSYCNLNNVILTNSVNLKKLYLDWNNLTIVSNLPYGIKFLDLSGNPIDRLQSKFLPYLLQLETLLLEDMPQLKSIDDYSLFGLPAMRTLSFQNSRKLNNFSSHAFGMNVILNETDIILETLNLQGTGIKSINNSLHFVFDNLKYLNLAGTPLLCDCDLIWIQKLNIETDGRCIEPSRLRGWKLSKVSEQQFNCKTSPKWVLDFINSLLILTLIILCLGGIWLIVLGLKPKKVIIRKIGATSPYAPVTIEPNRAE